MKHFTLLFLFALGLFQGPLNAQRRGHAHGVRPSFHQVFARITVQRTDQAKMNLARNYFNLNRYTVAQLRQVMFQLRFDANKVILAKESYHTVSDIRNFHAVFYTISNAYYQRDLRQFIANQRVIHRGGSVNFPQLSYPNAGVYSGPMGCNGFADLRTFQSLSMNLYNASSDYNRQQLLIQYMGGYAFSVEQFMKMLTIIGDVDIRYNLACQYHPQLYDLNNRHCISEVFGQTAYCDQFLGIPGIRQPSRGYLYAQPVTEVEMQQILLTLQAESFDRTKLSMAKAIIKSKGAFTVEQIGRIMGQFTFDSYRLELAKYAHPFTVDHSDYYLLANQLKFNSYRRSLYEFINSHP